jgi:hypothetical protein
MRLFALLFLAGCGVGFERGDRGGGGAAASTSTDTMPATGGSGAGAGGGGSVGVGGSGGSAGPRVLTVCANDTDYGLNGVQMPGNDDKLENGEHFGPDGTVDVTFDVVIFGSDELNDATLLLHACDIVQVGMEENEVGSGSGYSSLMVSQVAALRAWSMTPGNVVVAPQGFAAAWGNYVATSGVSNPMVAPAGGSPLFTGPFGDPAGFNQGGTFQGKWETLASNQYCSLIEDSAGQIVGFSDRFSGDVFFADVDVISKLGGASSGADITNANDILFANLYALLAQYAVGKVTDPCP